MPKPPIRIVPHRNGWANMHGGSDHVAQVLPTRAEAQAAGRQTYMNDSAKHIIHYSDGKIRSCDSYGNDPYPPRG